DPEVLIGIITALRAAVPSVTLATETAIGAFFEADWPDPHRDPVVEWSPHGDLDVLRSAPVGKLLALAPSLTTEDFLVVVEEVLADRGHLAYSGAFGLAEINPVGVTKAVALERWSAERSVLAEQVWAFGDMPNDLPMIEWAGLGVAVANAHP